MGHLRQERRFEAIGGPRTLGLLAQRFAQMAQLNVDLLATANAAAQAQEDPKDRGTTHHLGAHQQSFPYARPGRELHKPKTDGQGQDQGQHGQAKTRGNQPRQDGKTRHSASGSTLGCGEGMFRSSNLVPWDGKGRGEPESMEMRCR